MNKLSVGFARMNITPMRNIDISGYFVKRKNSGILDELEVNALALEADGKRVLMLSADLINVVTPLANACREAISNATGVPAEAIFIHGTHTHTGPVIDVNHPLLKSDEEKALVAEYVEFFRRRTVDVSLSALDDLKPAKMGFGVGRAENIAFIRRYRMKDGTVRTNPGVNNPDILHPIGQLDESVNVIRFDREGADSIAFVNFADHPDTVGGDKISADWPGFVRKTVEKALDGVKCIFFNGAQGDVNHVNVHPTGGYLNDMFMDFDDVARGYKHAEYMGRVVAGSLLQVWDKVEYVDVEGINFAQKVITVPSNRPDPSELPEARRINDLHLAGKDDEIPYKGMVLTTMLADARRKVRLEHGPDSYDMRLSAVSIGDIAVIGLPGEPFNSIGRGIKAEAKGWRLVIPCCLTNGSVGYFPSTDAYVEGGYEARGSSFKEGIAERLVENGVALLNSIKA